MIGPDAVERGALVRAAYAHADGERGRGRVVGYSDAPMVCIRRPDGTSFWWRAHLCHELDDRPRPRGGRNLTRVRLHDGRWFITCPCGSPASYVVGSARGHADAMTIAHAHATGSAHRQAPS